MKHARMQAVIMSVMVLAGSGADFVVESPPELAEKVAEVGARFSRSA